MSLYLPIIAVNRSQSVRIGNAQSGVTGSKVPQELGSDILASGATSVPYYVDITVAENRRDLQRHSAIGSYVIVGQLTSSNVDTVVASGATTSPTNLVITVAAGELKIRSTGAYVAVAGGTTTLSAADATRDRTDLVWVDSVTGAQGHTSGVLATAGSSVAPATPAGKTPVATYLVAAAATAATLVADVRPRP